MAIKKTDNTQVYHIICELDSAVIKETKEEAEANRLAGKLSRHEEYLETLDESKLVLKDPSEDKPTKFAIRCLRNEETAEVQHRHTKFDMERRQMVIKNSGLYFLELFNIACLGIVKEDGSIEKVKADDIPFGIATSVGSTIAVFTTLGRNLKNV